MRVRICWIVSRADLKLAFLFLITLSGLSYFILFTTDIQPVPYNMQKSGCLFPKLNPWDSTVLKLIKSETPLSCPQVQPYLTYVDSDGILNFNKTELDFLKENNFSSLKCYYLSLDNYREGKIFFRAKKIFKKPVKLNSYVIDVICSIKNSEGQKIKGFYRNVHAHPQLGRKSRVFSKPTEEQLSVLFILIDSVSASAFKRHMPKTYHYITKTMQMIVFNRFNKVGDNTQPNTIAALTGKRVYDEQADMPSEMDPNFFRKPLDHLPLVWKHFAAKGYATLFNEDEPNCGMFNYMLKGFENKPVDFYYHVYWRHVQQIMDDNNSTVNSCFGNSPMGDIMMDIVKRHIISMNDELRFVFSLFSSYTHNFGARLQATDELYVKFWKEVFEGGYLNKTVVIFGSDHGHRFSEIRKTLLGLLEERNPFYAVWFPQWFYDQNPHIRNNLLFNRNRLCSTFDIHETLKDILVANYQGVQRSLSSRGLSQLYPLPSNRTCTQAGIPQAYCLCINDVSIDIDKPYLAEIATVVETHLNKLISSFKQCRIMKYRKIIRAEMLNVNFLVKNGFRRYDVDANELTEKLRLSKKKSNDENENVNNIRILIEFNVNRALFEATVVKAESKNGTINWKVVGNIQRLNSYKTSSLCVNDIKLKKFCLC